jgi:hypothetical protein
MFDSGFEAIGQAVVAAFCSAAIFAVTMSFFGSRPKQQNPDSVASFFELDELISRKNLWGLTLFFSAPFALLFFVVSVVSPAFVDLGRKFLIDNILSLVSDTIKNAAEPVLNGIPNYLSPLFILIATSVLFAPYVRSPFEWFRNLVIAATGIDARAEDSGSRAAEEALSAKTETQIQSILPVNVPTTLTDVTNRVAYIILHKSIVDTRLYGLQKAITNTLNLLDAKKEIEVRSIRLSPARIVAALVFYFVLSLIWVLIVPLAATPLKDSFVAAFFGPIEWPLPEFREDLVLSISRHTLAFIVPLAFGMYLYPARREQFEERKARTETAYQTFFVVFSIQFIASVAVNFLFDVIDILLRLSNRYDGVHISLYDVKIWADVVIPALAPGFALAVWILCRSWNVRLLTYIAVCVAGAVSFSLCQLSYECISGKILGYYWHELFLGAFMTLAYFFAASIAQDVVQSPEPPADRHEAQAATVG